MSLDVYKDWLGIQAKERPLDHYALLGLSQFEDDRAVIQKLYRKRTGTARQYASGKYQDESQDLLDELARAMLTLTDPGRKNDYDRSLGRKVEKPATETREYDVILLEEGKLNKSQLNDAKGLTRELGIDLRNALIQRGYLKWETATFYLAQHYNMPYVNPLEMSITAEVIKLVDAKTAQRFNIFPLIVDDDNLMVAVSDALEMEALDSIRFEAGRPVRAVLCSPPAIQKLIKEHFSSNDPAAVEEDEEDEEEKESFSLAGFLWHNVMWLGPVVMAIAGALGYALSEAILPAVLSAVVAAILFAVLLFTAK